MNFSSANIAGLLPAIAALSCAAATDSAAQESGQAPVVVELFSSQSCSSCITAAEYFRELAARDDIVALGWHVDYWNHLDTRQGRWEDIYSSKEHTKRQKKYNINIRKRSSIYTPQIVVDGSYETVGSSREKVSVLISNAQTNHDTSIIEVRKEKNGGILFTVGRSRTGGNAYFVTFQRSIETEIKGGENAGVDFVDANVVTNVKRLGVVQRAGAKIIAEPPAAGEGCALLIQEPGQRRIVAASYCP